jgi:uncharacterized protein (DUF1778 family)
MQIFCSTRQHEILVNAADAAGTDVHTYVIGHAMRGAGKPAEKGTPLVIDGSAADKLREAAAAQGINATKLVDQLLVGLR